MVVIGEISVITVRYQQKNHCLTLCALKGKSPSLLGRDWLYQLRLYIQGLWKTTCSKLPSTYTMTYPRWPCSWVNMMVSLMRSLHVVELIHLKPLYIWKKILFTSFARLEQCPLHLKETSEQELNHLTLLRRYHIAHGQLQYYQYPSRPRMAILDCVVITKSS